MMAFRQQHRPQSSRQAPLHEAAQHGIIVDVDATCSAQRKRTLEDSQEWVLFSPIPPSTSARTHTTSTDRTPRTLGLSRFSACGSLETAARSQDDDVVTCHGTEDEELDSLDDGLHAFHEPCAFAGPSRSQRNDDTVLPTHDGLGAFQPDAGVQEHTWQFERPAPRRRQARRRSSVLRRFEALDEQTEITQEQDRRQRIEQWRLDQSKALLEEIERETRRRRRMSVASAARSQLENMRQEVVAAPGSSVSGLEPQSESPDGNAVDLSFWQRLTQRVIRDLMGIDEDTLSVIFGESLPEEVQSTPPDALVTGPSIDDALRDLKATSSPGDDWEHRLLERVARELGILVHQLSEHPGAFSTYRLAQSTPAYAGLSDASASASHATDPSGLRPRLRAPALTSTTSTIAFPTTAPAVTYSEASLWGIEEEPEYTAPADTPRRAQATTSVDVADEIARDREHWERELDVKMVFNFLVKRFTSRRPSTSARPRSIPSGAASASSELASARRAAIIRQHHPLVNRRRDDLPTSSSQMRRKDSGYKPASSLKSQVLKSSSSYASQSTKKSKRAAGNGRNYWDMGGSVGNGSVIVGEV